MKSTSNNIYTKYQLLLYALVLVLVFEGIVRKVVPSALGMVVFFMKDVICIITLYYILLAKFSNYLGGLYNNWKILFIIFVPVLLYTAFLDLPLSIFAAKQYLLYVTVAFLVPMAFPSSKVESFKRFVAFVALLIVPTLVVSILQNSLPPSHWLNLSVGGESLEGFSAGGQLRVSSTFSFTGQYSWFLNSACAFWVVMVFLFPNIKFKQKTLISALVGAALLLSVFITGGRTSVLGSGACLFIGFILSSWKLPSLMIRKGVIALLFLASSLVLFRTVKPEFFAAYDERSNGTGTMSHGEEMQGRILGGFIDWTHWFWDQDMTSILIGNGLGIMSNGSDKISSYASRIRTGGFWMEGDVPTTAWEGGLYLLIVWYVFRATIILFCVKLWYSTKSKNYTLASSFLLANVIINGITGNIGMQPPVAIWWWLSVGAIIAIQEFDKREHKLKSSALLVNKSNFKIVAA